MSAATVIQMSSARNAQALTQADLERLAQIQQKRIQGKAITEEERATLGRFAEMMVDTMEVPENGALQNILKRFLVNGEISQKEQAQLHEALGPIADIKENPQLTAHLRALRAKGSASDAEIDQVIKLAGKLSVHEDDAIYATLASLAIARGITPEAAEKIQKYIDRERIDREKYANKQSAGAQGKRIGLMALALIGITALFAVAPVAALGTAGAIATQLGVTVGAVFGIQKAAGALAKSNNDKILNYGVHE